MNLEKLKEIVRTVLPSVDVVIGYKKGLDALHPVPCFLTSPDEIDALVLNPACMHNLAAYLPSLKNRAAVVVKGCDSRTVVQLAQEGLIKRENVVVIGVPCQGAVSVRKVLSAIDHQPVIEASFENDTVVIKTKKGEARLALRDVAPDKCLACRYPTPVVADHLAGEEVEPKIDEKTAYQEIREFDARSLEERRAYWMAEFDRCIRCYACRNACPLCVCRESCIAETRDPHWMSQKATQNEKMMFHMIHAIHLAGRCTECGECERACPMGIPVARLKKKINMEMKELFGYEPGISMDDKPPMYTFKVEEEKIEEHKIR
ncbi:MAG TPA: 4Fe-4S dicluster domain-containing protein [Syntrophorhabdales bacterium]|nr:4Fe-4S dicluster domain-containing protein [Syntrophorhabdales bacterium]